MLVSVMTYREITGDSETATAEVTRVLTEAQQLLEDDLERPLEQASFTESLLMVPDPVTGVAMVFPRVTPIISVDGGLSFQDGVIYGPTPTSSPSFDAFGSPPTVAEVTYTGDFDPDETDSSEPDYVPRYLTQDVAWAAWQLLQPSTATSEIPSGATSVRVGDVAVTFDGPQHPGATEIRWSRQTLRWKRRHP